MSREIKFRAWDKKQNKMLHGVSIGTIKVWDENAPIISHEFSYSENCIFEQYTGLKDKHGKEIYEGDIVESTWNGDKAEVVWNDVEGELEHYADFNTHSKYSGSVVIGNIHENPELLGSKDDN